MARQVISTSWLGEPLSSNTEVVALRRLKVRIKWAGMVAIRDRRWYYLGHFKPPSSRTFNQSFKGSIS